MAEPASSIGWIYYWVIFQNNPQNISFEILNHLVLNSGRNISTYNTQNIILTHGKE